MHDVDQAVRQAFAARAPEDAHVSEIFARVDLPPRRTVEAPRSHRRPLRVVVAAALLTAIGTGVAVAAVPEVRHALFGTPKPASDVMQSLEQPQGPVEPYPSVFGEPADSAVPAPVSRALSLREPLRDPDQVKLLLQRQSPTEAVRIYAGVSQSGDVCYVATGLFPGAGSGTCVETFSAEQPVFFTSTGGDDGAAVMGIAADQVTRVEVLTAEKGSQPAELERNAFFWSSTRTQPTAVISHLRDGTEMRFSIENEVDVPPGAGEPIMP